jgi:hypothetical protein
MLLDSYVWDVWGKLGYDSRIGDLEEKGRGALLV